MEIQTDSIMKTASRSLVKSFAKVLGLFSGLIVAFILFSMFTNRDLLPPQSQPTLLPDAHGQRKLLPLNTPAILVLRIDNVIGMGDLTTEKFKQLLLDSRTGLFERDRLKGIMLYINSPGGSAVDSDNIYTMLMNYKQEHKIPVYGFVDGLCASGGMYIASACDKIYSVPTSTIGSVGVRVGPNFNFVGTMEKYGVSSLTFTQGKDKDMLNPFRPWTPQEGQSIQNVIQAMYDRFVNIVSSSRPKLTKELLINQFGANVFIASQAEENGYIDNANASYETTVQDLVKSAGIADGDAYQVIQLNCPHSLVEQFTQAKLETMIRNAFGLPNQELNGKILFM
jgi:protease IV